MYPLQKCLQQTFFGLPNGNKEVAIRTTFSNMMNIAGIESSCNVVLQVMFFEDCLPCHVAGDNVVRTNGKWV